jgi:MFS transporter, UMF1 family
MASPSTRESSSERTGTLGLWSWALYDWANQPFATLFQTFVFSVYFTRSVAQSQTSGSAQWGTALGVAGLVVAIAGPMLGAIADQGGRRKPWIVGFALLCVTAIALMWFVEPSPEFVWLALVLVGLASIGSELSLVFYNSLLPRLVSPDRVGRWSGWAWGLGYAGGLVCLAVALTAFIAPKGAWLGLNAEAAEPVRAVALFSAAWYLLFALPLFIITPDAPGAQKPLATMMRDGMRQLGQTFREVRRHGPILRFLVAHMIYVDGLATLFAFGGIYAAGTFGLSGEMLLVLGIALNLAAGVGAFAFAWVDDRIGSKATVLLSLAALIMSGTSILLIDSSALFWVLALTLGLFVGPAQAAGRSLLARMAPRHLQSQMFGFFALSGKATAFLGPLLAGWITYWASSQRVGMATIVVLFAIGLLVMLTVPGGKEDREPAPSTRG